MICRIPWQPMAARLAQRLPRRTVRLRLTLLYGTLFLLSGTVLLVITYVLVAHRFPTLVTVNSERPRQAAGGIAASGLGTACRTAPIAPVPPGRVIQCMREAQTAGAKQQAAELNQLLTQSGVALAIMSVFSIALGWLVAGRVLRPLRTITATARLLSANNLNQRLALAGPDDELKELSDTFDGLLARLEASFAAQRQFVANASHELRTPLARQRTVMEVALADPERTVGSLSQACTQVLAAGEQQERLIEALLTLARSQRGLDRREPVDLAAVTADVLRSRRPEAERSGITVDARLGLSVAPGDARLAERLAANLVDNALRHNVPGGWVRIKSGSRPGYAFLAIANSGPVIAADEVDRLFEPFQRLAGRRVSRDGLGLGLSIVRAIAAAHHGQLRARPLPTGGLDIQLRFPTHPAPFHGSGGAAERGLLAGRVLDRVDGRLGAGLGDLSRHLVTDGEGGDAVHVATDPGSARDGGRDRAAAGADRDRCAADGGDLAHDEHLDDGTRTGYPAAGQRPAGAALAGHTGTG